MIGDKEDQRITRFEQHSRVRLGKSHRSPAEPELPDAEPVLESQSADGFSLGKRAGFYLYGMDMGGFKECLEILDFLLLDRIGTTW